LKVFEVRGLRQKHAGDSTSNLEPQICNLGYGDPSKLLPRLARLEFDEASTIM